MSTRVYRPQQLVDCQVSTFSDQARDHGLPGVSPGIPPLQNLWRFVLFHGWQSGISCDKEKLEPASKIVKLPGCHNKSLLLNVYFVHLFILHFIITFYILFVTCCCIMFILLIVLTKYIFIYFYICCIIWLDCNYHVIITELKINWKLPSTIILIHLFFTSICKNANVTFDLMYMYFKFQFDFNNSLTKKVLLSKTLSLVSKYELSVWSLYPLQCYFSIIDILL